jgi:hypothetical protein
MGDNRNPEEDAHASVQISFEPHVSCQDSLRSTLSITEISHLQRHAERARQRRRSLSRCVCVWVGVCGWMDGWMDGWIDVLMTWVGA